MIPYVIAALLVAALSFGAGWKVASNAAAAKELVAVKAAQVAYHEMENQYEDAAYDLEVARAEFAAKRAATSAKVQEVAARPAYQHDCLDADGVQLFNDAIGAPGTSDPAKPVERVPSPNETR